MHSYEAVDCGWVSLAWKSGARGLEGGMWLDLLERPLAFEPRELCCGPFPRNIAVNFRNGDFDSHAVHCCRNKPLNT